MRGKKITVRWTIGDVSQDGFEALRLSVLGMTRLLGPEPTYVICVNSVSLDDARERAGNIPPAVVWHDATNELPECFRRHLDGGMAEGVGWKFAPVQLAPDSYELALDNDCILWDLPQAIRHWLDQGTERTCVMAEDVKPCFGQFQDLCGCGSLNSGIRGVPANFPLEDELLRTLEIRPVMLASELDEQGLQVATLRRASELLVVRLSEVAICSPFPPHLPSLGSCGVHFVGLNARELPWSIEGRGASSYIREHWRRHRDEIYRKVGDVAGAI